MGGGEVKDSSGEKMVIKITHLLPVSTSEARVHIHHSVDVFHSYAGC